MKLLAIVPILALVVSQTLALPTNGNRDQIDFIGDSIVHRVNDANREQRIEFLQENEAENLEEALKTYTDLLLNRLEQKAGKQPKPKPIAERPNDQISIEAQLPDLNVNQHPTYYDNQLNPTTEELTIKHQPNNDQLHPNIEGPDTSNNVVYDHTASDASCDCSQLKYSTFKRINRENGDSCIVGLGVPYCEKVYSASYGYEDQAWVEPRAAGYETYQYTGIKYQNFHTVCKDSNGNYYSFSQAYLVPSGCQCSSSSFCRKR